MSDVDNSIAAAPQQQDQQREQLPDAGGSYERQGDGTVKRVEFTEPAPDRAAAEPDERGTAVPAEETDAPRRTPAAERQE